MKTEFTDTQRSLITNGLRIAAEKYEVNAGFCRSFPHFPQFSLDLAVTFDKQAEDSRALAQTIEDADSLTATQPDPEPKPFLLVWGAGDTEQNRQEFDSLDEVRGMLAHDTDMTPAMIEQLIETGKSADADTDPTACTQFDSAWIRLERR